MLDIIGKKSTPEASDYESSDQKPLRKSMIHSLNSSLYSRGGLNSIPNSRKSQYMHIKYSMYEGGEEKSRSIGSRGSSKKSKASNNVSSKIKSIQSRPKDIKNEDEVNHSSEGKYSDNFDGTPENKLN